MVGPQHKRRAARTSGEKSGLARRTGRLLAAAACLASAAIPPARAADAPEGAGAIGLKQEAADTASALRRAIIKGVAAGRRETTHVDTPEGTKRAKVTGATPAHLAMSASGATFRIAWDKVAPGRLYALGVKYVRPTDAKAHLRLARYCVASDLSKEAGEELDRALRKDRGILSDAGYVEARALLRKKREPLKPKAVSREPPPSRPSRRPSARGKTSAEGGTLDGVMPWPGDIEPEDLPAAYRARPNRREAAALKQALFAWARENAELCRKQGRGPEADALLADVERMKKSRVAEGGYPPPAPTDPDVRV